MIRLFVLDVPGLREEIARQSEDVRLTTRDGSEVTARVHLVLNSRREIKFWGVLEAGVKFVATMC